MDRIFKSEYSAIIGIILVFFILLPFFYLHQGSVFVDIGREFYIPSQMLKGQVLYKDILNIYGAFAYQINAILFLLFGEKITTLYNFGIFNSLVFVLTIYFISREFLGKQQSFLIGILTIFSTVYTEYIFNTNMPYSYSLSYALSSFSLSALFLIRYIKTSNNKFAILSSLFLGMSLSSKLDFAPTILVFIYVFCFLKPLDLKNKLFSLLSFSLIPLISISILLFQGMNYTDISSVITLIKQLTQSNEFDFFYKNGYTLNSLIRRLISFVIIVIIFIASKYKARWADKNKFLGFGISLTLLILISMTLMSLRFIALSSLPILLICLFTIKFKKIYKDKSVFILTILTILSGIKFSLYINTEHFGAFILPLFILAFIVIIKYYIQEQKHYNYFLILFLTAIICVSAAKDFYFIQNKNFLIKTPKGEIYTTKKEGSTFKTLYEFANNELNETDRILILPEGSFFNFTSSFKSDNKYYSLIPLYVGMFKEEKLIQNFSQNLPEYIVIHDLDESDFGKQYLCVDYAQNFCKTILSNYKTVAFFNETGYKMFVYKRNN